MPTPGLGHKSYIQFGIESTYASATTPTNRCEIISATVNPVIGVIRDPSLNDQPSRRALYQGGQMHRGTIVTRMNYQGLLKLFDGVFGTDSYGSAGGSGSGAGPYTYVFTEGDLLNSYTIEIGEGDIPTGKVQKLVGAVFTGVTIRATAGTGDDAMLRAEWGVLASEKLTDQTPTGSLSAPDIDPVLYHHATVVNDGVSSSDRRVRNFEITLNNNVSEDRFYLGSINIDQPLRNDFLMASFRLTQEFNDIAQYEAARDFTTGSPELVFTSGTNVMDFRMNEAVQTDFSTPVEGYGIILANQTWEGFRSNSNADSSALCVEVTNDDSSI